ncbi:hypothetical protein C7999DRAFT_40805 [Corynascus novoguineensis]|uniref:Uncharacterized protein n=1 Tax=Corynascus novoguineensis TaxID=1126955 RepID=A0AAN7HPI4_9PEZI|nr:hypothetical protein C7999DRAFT_40805 [Corynascus novoguineensis]
MATQSASGDADAPPAYREVTDRELRQSLRSEKALLQISENGSTPMPADARRRCLWRRIWSRLVASRRSRNANFESLVDPSLPSNSEKPQQSSPPLDSPTGTESQYYDDDGWKKPVTTCSLQRGRLPPRGRWRYTLTRQHCPIERATPEALDAAPWIANALEKPAWLENLHRCFSDKISAKHHPLLPNKKLFRRRIKLYFRSPDGTSLNWAAGISIWHRDSQWLADLSYERMATMFRPETMICASAHTFPIDDILDVGKVFYLVFPKSCCTLWWPPCFQGDGRCLFRRISATNLYLDDPELRNLAHSYFESQLPGGRPPPMKMCPSEKVDAECACYNAFFT